MAPISECGLREAGSMSAPGVGGVVPAGGGAPGAPGHSAAAGPMRLRGGVVALVLLLCAGWGGLGPAIKIALREVPPVALAGWRFLIGLAAIALWCRLRRIPVRPTPGRAPLLLFLAASFVLQIALLNIGARSTSGGHSVLLLSTHPIFVAIFAHFLLHGDRLALVKVLGLLLALGGVAVVVADRLAGGSPGGDALILVSAVLLGLLLTVTKWALQRGMNPYELLVRQMVPGVPAFFLVSWWLEGPIHWPVQASSWASIAYQGLVVAGFCFVAWSLLLERYPASRLTAFQFTTPLFGIVSSALILGEPLTWGMALGTLLVGIGLLLVNREA